MLNYHYIQSIVAYMYLFTKKCIICICYVICMPRSKYLMHPDGRNVVMCFDVWKALVKYGNDLVQTKHSLGKDLDIALGKYEIALSTGQNK